MTYFFDRLDNFMHKKGLNDNKITVDSGISNGLIGKARKRGSLSQENISKILNTYRELDANWLLTGEGQMFKGLNAPLKEETSILAKDSIDSVEKVLNYSYKTTINALEKTIAAQQETILALKELIKEKDKK